MLLADLRAGHPVQVRTSEFAGTFVVRESGQFGGEGASYGYAITCDAVFAPLWAARPYPGRRGGSGEPGQSGGGAAAAGRAAGADRRRPAVCAADPGRRP